MGIHSATAPKYATAERVENNMHASCAIETATGNGMRIPGSGCLVDGSPLGLPEFCIVTCHHCISTEGMALRSTAIFEKTQSHPGQTIRVRLDPHAGFDAAAARPLDYCFCAVLADDIAKLVKCAPVPLPIDVQPREHAPITIWQHPQGGAKVMSLWLLDSIQAADGALHYQNDTEPGSSGAPIFDHVGRLIGIHTHGPYGGGDANGGCLLSHAMAHARSCRHVEERTADEERANEAQRRREASAALWAAAGDGAAERVDGLLEAGADLEFENLGWTPLLKATMSGNVEVVRRLLAVGARVDAVSRSGDTALLLAAYWGEEAVARMLAAAGADVAARDVNGELAVEKARRQGHASIAAFLEELGAEGRVEDAGAATCT